MVVVNFHLKYMEFAFKHNMEILKYVEPFIYWLNLLYSGL